MSPKHIAIIMDGNRRWAKKNNRTLEESYKEGCLRAMDIVHHCINKIPFLTIYAFSTENWTRNKQEVSIVMRMAEEFLLEKISELNKIKVRVNFIGEKELIPQAIQNIIQLYEEKNTNDFLLSLNIAFSYGGRSEIVTIVKNIINNPPANINSIDEKYISNMLYTNTSPDPDLLIRTGGMRRVSNFLLWQIAYTEIFFIDDLWPDFNITKFNEVIESYKKIKKNLGR